MEKMVDSKLVLRCDKKKSYRNILSLAIVVGLPSLQFIATSILLLMLIMVKWIVKFSREGYKISEIFCQKSNQHTQKEIMNVLL